MQIEQTEKKKDGKRKRMQSSPSPTKRMKIEQEAPVKDALPKMCHVMFISSVDPT